jgi:hypothetical protein
MVLAEGASLASVRLMVRACVVAFVAASVAVLREEVAQRLAAPDKEAPGELVREAVAQPERDALTLSVCVLLRRGEAEAELQGVGEKEGIDAVALALALDVWQADVDTDTVAV